MDETDKEKKSKEQPVEGADPFLEFEEQNANSPVLSEYQREVSFWRAKLTAAASIRKAREQAAFSTGELAFKLEISEQEILDLESINSDANPPSLAFMYQVADVCKMELGLTMLEVPPGTVRIRWTPEAADSMRILLRGKD